MAENQPLPAIEGTVYLKDMGRGDMAKRDGRAVARRLSTTDHAEGRYVVGGREASKPVLVQRNADDGGFNSPAEMLVVDGTAATQLKIQQDGKVSVPLPSALPLEAVIKGEVPPTPIEEPLPAKAASVPLDRSVAAIPEKAVAAAPQAPSAQPRTMVTITGDGIGKLRVFCRRVILSERLLILVYPLDGSTAIVEPPKTGTDNLLTVTVDGHSHQCASLDMSFEYDDLLMVVLVKV